MNTDVQTEFAFLADGSDKLFLNFSTQIYLYIPGSLFHSATHPLESRMRWYDLPGARFLQRQEINSPFFLLFFPLPFGKKPEGI